MQYHSGIIFLGVYIPSGIIAYEHPSIRTLVMYSMGVYTFLELISKRRRIQLTRPHMLIPDAIKSGLLCYHLHQISEVAKNDTSTYIVVSRFIVNKFYMIHVLKTSVIILVGSALWVFLTHDRNSNRRVVFQPLYPIYSKKDIGYDLD